MNEPTQNTEPTTVDNLLAAFANLQPMPVVEFEYRVYYDARTRQCTIKTFENFPKGLFVIVNREQYDAIEFCPNYCVTPHGSIEKNKFDYTPKKMLHLTINGQYKTVKDDIIFRVDDAYLGVTDCWSIKDFDAN